MSFRPQRRDHPEEFLCAFSRKLMRDPVEHSPCRKVFDRSAIRFVQLCPFDHTKFENLIPCADLKERITRHLAAGGFGQQRASAVKEVAKGKVAAQKEACLWGVKRSDDEGVHACCLFGDDVFEVRRNGSLFHWNDDGRHASSLYQRDDDDLTALGANGEVLVAGGRNGSLHAWNRDGEQLNKDPGQLDSSWIKKCGVKLFNPQSVYCIDVLSSRGSETLFFAGFGASFCLVRLDKEGNFSLCSRSKVYPDAPVYWVQPASRKNPLGDVLVVTRGEMELRKRDFKKDPLQEDAWRGVERLVVSKRGKQIVNPPITAIEKRPGHEEIAYSCLHRRSKGAPVRILDINRAMPTRFKALKHTSDVRAIAFLDANTLASGEKEGTVYIWDVRAPEETCKLRKHKTLSTLTAVGPNRLLVTSYSREEDQSNLRLWDVRMLKTDLI